jgi:hypothetical protein
MPRPVAVPTVTDEPDEESATTPARIVTVDYEGHTYTYDLDEIEIDTLEDWDDGKKIRAVRAILGAEQWATYKTRHRRAVEIDRFMVALLDAAAGAAGNPSASSAS